MSDDKYTPNMEKLKAELGRTPPSMVDQSRPLEDYAPKPKLPYVSPNWEVEMAQRIKELMRQSDDWGRLTWGEREALDEIASQIAGVCVGRHYWDDILESAEAGKRNREP